MTENITVFRQNSIRIGSESGVIYVDPFQMEDAPHDADFILITHDHYDHFSPESIEMVANGNTVLIAPEKMLSKAEEAAGLAREIVTVRPGERRCVGGLEFETVPAYNVAKRFHPKSAEWVGYILVIDGKRVYIAGDTDATDEAKAVRCDIALVPVGGTYTMDAKEAAELVNVIRPETAIPVHYGGIVGSAKDGEKFAKKVKAPVKAELKIRF